jgi:hypothetical protein
MGKIGDCLHGLLSFFFENKWKGWLRDEVREHADTIHRMNSGPDRKRTPHTNNNNNNSK